SLRFKIALVGFFGGANIFIQRSNLSIAIVCMVNHTAVDELILSQTDLYWNSSRDNLNAAAHQNETSDGEFVWTKETQGLLLGAVFWGYVIFQMIGGLIVEKVGLRHGVGPFIILLSILTFLSHPAALWSPWALFAVRFLLGVTCAVCMPGLFFLLSNWAPLEEKSRFTSIVFNGNVVGNAVIFPIAGLLCSHGFAGGWPSIFHVSGIFSFVCSIMWYIFVYDTPDEHPFISCAERDYIKSSLEMKKSTIQMKTPWCSIITSIPVYAVVCAHISTSWGLYLMLSNLPMYMREILKFDATSNGLFTMLPYICMSMALLLYGLALDKLTKRFGHSISRRSSAALDFILGMILPAVLMIGISYLDCQYAVLSIAFLCVTIACFSLLFSGVLVNVFDIAPRYAGQIMTFSNTLSNITGIITPYAVAKFTPNNTLAEWQKVFFLSAGIIGLGGILFIIFAKTEVQKWAIEQSENDSKKIEVTKY
ncbi:hypothetical protein LOTGIDRAFT_118721, partial [Lottia gigantea]